MKRLPYQEVPYTYESIDKHHELNCKGLQSISEWKNKEGVYGFDRFKAIDMKKDKIYLAGILMKESITKHFDKLKISGLP